MKKYLLLALCLLISGCETVTFVPDKPFPNPYVVEAGVTQIYFNDLAAVCTIEISTFAGVLVRTITETDGDGQAVWDLKNDDGEDLTAGIYLYIIKDAERTRKGKVIITI